MVNSTVVLKPIGLGRATGLMLSGLGCSEDRWTGVEEERGSGIFERRRSSLSMQLTFELQVRYICLWPTAE